MKYVYAALLLHSAGKPINEASIKEVLGSAGIAVEDVRVKALVASLSEIKIDEVLKNASTLAVAAPAAVAAAAPAAAKPEEKPKDEGKKEEEALAGLGALFG